MLRCGAGSPWAIAIIARGNILPLADSLYLRVPRPPHNPDVAGTLAREHPVYCDSIEEASDIDSLAGLLNRATAWRCWWD